MIARRPVVRINCAISLDGKLAYSGGRPARLSGPEDLARVHRMRADSDAILVGIGTVTKDDPSLRVHWQEIGRLPGREPLRVVLDSQGRTPPGARVLDGRSPTLIATNLGCARSFPSGIESFQGGSREVDLGLLLAELDRRGIRSLMVEGGSNVIASFLRGGWVDELSVYIAPVLIGGLQAPSLMAGAESSGPDGVVRLSLVELERLGEGVLLRFAVRSTAEGARPRRDSGRPEP